MNVCVCVGGGGGGAGGYACVYTCAYMHACILLSTDLICLLYYGIISGFILLCTVGTYITFTQLKVFHT